jgi:hypothetical protein
MGVIISTDHTRDEAIVAEVKAAICETHKRAFEEGKAAFQSGAANDNNPFSGADYADDEWRLYNEELEAAWNAGVAAAKKAITD